MASAFPVKIDQASETELAIDWNDGHKSVYPVRLLRLSCKCANCVEEMSGRPMLDPASVPAEVAPVVINPVGRYAIHIAWSDGHTTGIYTYEHLRGLCPCATCKPR
jgi:ATP-binding protein involved in chromosome partitioning